MEPLTVDTLKQAPRSVRNLLSELKIRCEFFDRGCGEFIELGDLERHVRDCGFAPAVCSNEGCELEVNKRDLLHHETVVCELRRVQCHSCNDIRQEMDTVKVNLAAMDEKLEKKLEKIEANGKASKEEVLGKVGLVQEQLNNQEVNISCVQADIVEVKKCLNAISQQLERMTQQMSHEVHAQQEQMKKGIAEADGMDEEPKVFVFEGVNGKREDFPAEIFSLSDGTWTQVKSVKGKSIGASSVVYNNEIIVMGGFQGGSFHGGGFYKGATKSMRKLSIKAIHSNKSITWENFPAELPGQMWGQCSVVYNGRLIIVGGTNDSGRMGRISDSITEIILVPPYDKKQLATMPHRISHHSVTLFHDKIVIVGDGTVVMYDITKNECKELAPLPYPVSRMATVKWGDDHIIIIGGQDSNGTPLNTVVMYNIKTQKSRMLPDMKCKREGCVAAVVRDTVIVMGGEDERGWTLNSVEGFKFDRFTWEELPGMHETRYGGIAVVC